MLIWREFLLEPDNFENFHSELLNPHTTQSLIFFSNEHQALVKITIYWCSKILKIKEQLKHPRSCSGSSTEKNKTRSRNNSVLVSGVDLSSSQQAVSMAGLNLFNHKTEANHTLLRRQIWWCACSHPTWFIPAKQKVFVLIQVPLAGDGEKAQRGGVSNQMTESIDWPGLLLWEVPAAGLVATEQGQW